MSKFDTFYAILGVIILIALYGCTQDEGPATLNRVEMRDIVIRDGLAYMFGDVEPFSGIAYERHENESLSKVISYSIGLKDGSSDEYYDDGNLIVSLDYSDGQIIDGDYTYYKPNGTDIDFVIRDKVMVFEIDTITTGSFEEDIRFVFDMEYDEDENRWRYFFDFDPLGLGNYDMSDWNIDNSNESGNSSKFYNLSQVRNHLITRETNYNVLNNIPCSDIEFLSDNTNSTVVQFFACTPEAEDFWDTPSGETIICSTVTELGTNSFYYLYKNPVNFDIIDVSIGGVSTFRVKARDYDWTSDGWVYNKLAAGPFLTRECIEERLEFFETFGEGTIEEIIFTADYRNDLNNLFGPLE